MQVAVAQGNSVTALGTIANWQEVYFIPHSCPYCTLVDYHGLAGSILASRLQQVYEWAETSYRGVVWGAMSLECRPPPSIWGVILGGPLRALPATRWKAGAVKPALGRAHCGACRSVLLVLLMRPSWPTLNGVVQQVHHDALPGQFKAPDAAAVRGFFDGCLGRPETVAFVAEDDRSAGPVGYVLAEEVRRPETPLTLPGAVMYLHHIAVVPAETRHGWGAALMRAVEDEAARRQLDEIRLDFWSFNDRAECFFAGLGYAPYNVRVSKAVSEASRR